MKNKPNEYAYEASGSRHSRFTSGRKADPQRRLAKAVIPLLLLVCILLSVTFLSFGGSLAGVNAGAEENGNVSETDLHSETASLPDDTYGHLYINAAPDDVIQPEGYAPGAIELCQQSLSLCPDGSGADTTVTLYGMMPEGASAEAVDVSRKYPEPDDVSDETDSEATVIAAYNITILDGEREYQPDASSPIRVEITDPSIVTTGLTEVWHIKDDGTREKLTDVRVTEGKIGFFATGFSVYAIINAPESYHTETMEQVTALSALTGERASYGFFLCYADSGGRKYFQNSVNGNGALKETTDPSQASTWFFEPDGANFKLYTYVGNAKKYVHNRTDNELELLSDTADALELSDGAKEDSFYLKKQGEDKWLQHSGSGKGIPPP